MQPKIIAVVLNLTNTPGLVDCLRSLDKTTYGSLEIIVVRNGPADNDFEKVVRAASSKIADVLFTGFNSGFAAGNNVAIKRALEKGAEYVLLLNDDTVVAPDFLGLLIDEALEDPSIGMLGPRIFYFSEPEKVSFSGAKFNKEKCVFSFPGADQQASDYGQTRPEETDYVTGCALMVSRKSINAIGLLDERFFLYWEDTDWSLRAAAAGFKLLIVPSAKVWHKLSASSGGNDSPVKIFHKTRGHLMFARIYSPGAVSQLILGFFRDAAWLVFKSGSAGKFKKAAAYLAGILDYILRKTGPGPKWIWN